MDGLTESLTVRVTSPMNKFIQESLMALQESLTVRVTSPMDGLTRVPNCQSDITHGWAYTVLNCQGDITHGWACKSP